MSGKIDPISSACGDVRRSTNAAPFRVSTVIASASTVGDLEIE